MPILSNPIYAALRLTCAALLSVSFAQGQTALTAAPNPSTLGQPVTLTATVAAGATGKVTFFDGSNILGISSVAFGQATLTTRLIPSGTRSLRAFYGGDISKLPSGSTLLTQTVSPVAITGFQSPAGF